MVKFKCNCGTEIIGNDEREAEVAYDDHCETVHTRDDHGSIMDISIKLLAKQFVQEQFPKKVKQTKKVKWLGDRRFCSQCGAEMNPVSFLINKVCGSCCKENQNRVMR